MSDYGKAREPSPDRASEVEEVHEYDEPATGLYIPPTFDPVSFEASKRRRLETLALLIFGATALVSVVVGPLIAHTATSVKLVLGIVGLTASIAGIALRLNYNRNA